MHSGLVLSTPSELVVYQGHLTIWNASDASSSRKGVKGLLSVSNSCKLALVSLVSKMLNISSQFADGKRIRSGMSVGGESFSLGWGSDHRNSDAITSRVVDEVYMLPETPVELMLPLQRMSLMPRSWWVYEFVFSGMTTQLDPITRLTVKEQAYAIR